MKGGPCMKNIFLISNLSRDPEYRLRSRACRFLTERGASCVQRELRDDKVPAGTECIVTLGGDGTMLGAIRQYVDSNVPFVGINTGTLGYLTEGNAEQMEEILTGLLEDSMLTERRMLLQGKVFRDGKMIGRHRALNDVVIGRTKSMKLIRMNLYINGQFLSQYRADGLIIATPTGSTGYSFSVGGPIVKPTAKLFFTTAIACHSLNNRSLVFASNDRIEVEIAPDIHYEQDGTVHEAYFDGTDSLPLAVRDRVEITQASNYVTILKRSERSFMETLAVKLSD